MADEGGSTRLLLQAVGAELRAIRERLDMTRAEALQRLRRYTGESIGERTLLSYESGERAMTVARLLQWALVYGVPARVIWQAAEARVREPVCRACGRP